MSYLYQVLTQRVDAWRAANYPCDAFPAIREILEFATEDGEAAQLRYLRRAQFRALETYWYLRLVLETPRIPDLYAKLFPKPKDRREAMGRAHPDIVSFIADEGLESCLERVKSGNAFVRQYALESLRESLTLDYASYILALAMGAGKTILMGSIVSQEQIRARTIAIAKGEYKPKAGEPKIWFTSVKSVAEVLSDQNRALLKVIRETNPDSMAVLA